MTFHRENDVQFPSSTLFFLLNFFKKLLLKFLLNTKNNCKFTLHSHWTNNGMCFKSFYTLTQSQNETTQYVAQSCFWIANNFFFHSFQHFIRESTMPIIFDTLWNIPGTFWEFWNTTFDFSSRKRGSIPSEYFFFLLKMKVFELWYISVKNLK